MSNKNRIRSMCAGFVLLCSGFAQGAEESAVSIEQDAAPKAKGRTAILMEEIVSRARKKSGAEEAQDVPVALTAFSGEQLEALQMHDLSEMAYSMPNVALDSNGTLKGTANFGIRGLGISSSIPSTDPVVGVFVDGMYYGVLQGVIMDTFDLESMEVLRGPQGLLFGRNVTGGAVTMRTRRPSHDFDLRAKTSITDDNDQVYAFSVTDSLVEDVLSGKFSAYYRDDNGYFDNRDTNNSHFGESETYLIRGGLTWTPTEDLEMTLLYERGEMEGDGAVTKNIQDKSLSDFQTDLNNEGNDQARWNQLIFETNYDVAFGDGTITNITTYRDFEQSTESEIDSTNSRDPGTFWLDLLLDLEQHQFSNELRFAGTFMDGAMDLTVGTFYFTQHQTHVEHRQIGEDFLLQSYGGDIDHMTWAVFTQADFHLNDAWTLTLGGRYSYEDKDAEIAKGSAFTFPCVADPSLYCNANFEDQEHWGSFTPKFGLQWYFNESAHLYFTYTKGFRSGGYNLRHTSPGDPGPYNQETQNAYEIGMKSEWMDGKVKLNLAAFHNEIEDMQRTIAHGFPPVQEIQNPASATITGAEMDLQLLLTDNLLVTVSAGYLDGDYDEVSGDLTGDGLVNNADERLDLKRLSPWTWQVGANYDIPLEQGLISLRASWNHRATSPWNDSNTTHLPSADMVDAGIAFNSPSGQWTTTLYAKNLLDEEIPAAILPLGAVSFAPITKGRVVGLELQYLY